MLVVTWAVPALCVPRADDLLRPRAVGFDQRLRRLLGGPRQCLCAVEIHPVTGAHPRPDAPGDRQHLLRALADLAGDVRRDCQGAPDRTPVLPGAGADDGGKSLGISLDQARAARPKPASRRGTTRPAGLSAPCSGLLAGELFDQGGGKGAGQCSSTAASIRRAVICRLLKELPNC